METCPKSFIKLLIHLE